MGARILVVDDSLTIRNIVRAILERNGYEPVLAEDGVDALEKLAEGEVELALVDFVMPRMNGYQFCMSLRKDERLKDLPVVLMSAKSDRIRGKFVQQTGALDAITKPFDARGLLAVVQSAIEKKERRDAGLEGPERIEEFASAPESMSSDLRASVSSSRVAEHLSKIFLPGLSREFGNVEAATLTQIFSQSLTPDAGVELLTLLEDTEFAQSKGHELLTGALESVSFADVLQLLDLQRKTGALTVSRNRSRVTFFMHGGALDLATYAGLPEEFLLGRYLLKAGVVSRPDLERASARAREKGELIGEHLVALELISEADLRAALISQTSELVYEVVRWTEGRFRFVAPLNEPLAERARLALPSAGLVMEGFRRVDEWRLIEGTFDFGDVLAIDPLALEKLGPSDLEGHERNVLAALDGVRTIGEVIDSLEFGSFESCKILYRLMNARIVKRK